MDLYVAEVAAATRTLKGKRYEEKIAVLCHIHKSSHLSCFGVPLHADRGHKFLLCKHEGNSGSVKLNAAI